MQADQPPVALAGAGRGRYYAGVVIAIEGETRAVTAERDLLVEVVLRRGEGKALQLALLPAPGWQHFGRPHTIETKYQFKTISKLKFSVYDQVWSLAVYIF